MTESLRLELPVAAAPEQAASNSAFFIGNATMLLRFAGFTILTDPTFVHMHEEVSLGFGMSTKRLTDPAIDIGQLPPIDFVLLSHFHGDHFDQVAERELDKDLPIITTPQATKDLAKRGFQNTHGIDTWQSISIGKGDKNMRITACPGRHGPGVTDLVLPDVMGSMLEAESAPVGVTERIYISGDTLVYDDLHEIPKRYPDVGLGVFHLGGTKVMGIMVTMDAEQGVEAVRIIDPQTVLPVHYDDYDVFTSSLDDFVAAAREAGLQDRVRAWHRGDTFDF